VADVDTEFHRWSLLSPDHTAVRGSWRSGCLTMAERTN
jgi:hypothetical protein